MAEKVLVAYASKYGSTGEVAEAVGDRLGELGIDVEVKPAREVRSLDEYQSVVLAAPFYIGSLLKDARKFLKRHQAVLEHMPVALLTLGPLKADDDMNEARQQLDKTLQNMPWLHPVAADMFIGAYDPAKLRFPDTLTLMLPTPLKNEPAHDERDWDAIRAWADALPQALGIEKRAA